MSPLPDVYDLPSVDKLDLSRAKPRCLGFVPSRGRQCIRVVKIDPKKAKLLDQEIVIAAGADGASASKIRSALVEKILETCCCWQHREKLCPQTELGQLYRRRWNEQLSVEKVEKSMARDIESDAADDPQPKNYSEPTTTYPADGNSPRYNLRSTLQDPSGSATGKENENTAGPLPEFTPMAKPRLSIGRKLLRGPTVKQACCTASLYAFSRRSSPGMLKLGKTEREIYERLGEWEAQCNYEPELRHLIEEVPYASFIESMAHAELWRYRRRETECLACHKQHQEWFEADDITVFETMDRWAKWASVARPFNADGQATPIWRVVIENMIDNEIEVTSQRLLDAMDTVEIDKDVEGEIATTASPAVIMPEVSARTTPTCEVAYTQDTIDIVSTLAAVISALTATQTRQLRDLLEPSTIPSVLCSFPPAPRLVLAA